MILIIGGKYQGKLEVAEEIVSRAADACLEIEDRCHEKVRRQISLGMSLEDILAFWEGEDFQDRILIFDEVSMGVVPMEKGDRIFREACGQVMRILAGKADQVYRVFCGIPLRLK